MHGQIHFSPPGIPHRSQSRVVLDPYARTIISRRQYGQPGADLQYGAPGVLGLMKTWPQAAAAVPDPSVTPFDWQGDLPLGLPMEQLVGMPLSGRRVLGMFILIAVDGRCSWALSLFDIHLSKFHGQHVCLGPPSTSGNLRDACQGVHQGHKQQGGLPGHIQGHGGEARLPSEPWDQRGGAAARAGECR